MNKFNFAAGKFAKGFLTGAGASFVAVLQAQGCQVTDLKTFGIAVGMGILSGGFHAAWNLMFNAPTRSAS